MGSEQLKYPKYLNVDSEMIEYSLEKYLLLNPLKMQS
jgi:hypothetical protein